MGTKGPGTGRGPAPGSLQPLPRPGPAPGLSGRAQHLLMEGAHPSQAPSEKAGGLLRPTQAQVGRGPVQALDRVGLR